MGQVLYNTLRVKLSHKLDFIADYHSDGPNGQMPSCICNIDPQLAFFVSDD